MTENQLKSYEQELDKILAALPLPYLYWIGHAVDLAILNKKS
jgi:hypothetical protein